MLHIYQKVNVHNTIFVPSHHLIPVLLGYGYLPEFRTACCFLSRAATLRCAYISIRVGSNLDYLWAMG